MNVDVDQIKEVISMLVLLGGFATPVVFAIIQMIKSFVPSNYLPLAAVVIGGLLGLAAVAIAPMLGIEGLNYAIGGIAGLIGGYASTKQYDSAAKQGFEKGLNENTPE